MHIALLAATNKELEFFQKSTLPEHHQYSFYCHGVGPMIAAANMHHCLQNKPDACIQVGIAGSYRPEIKPGTAVLVMAEVFGETGAESGRSLIDLFDMGLLQADEFPFRNKILPNPYATSGFQLPLVIGLSVSICSGTPETVHKRKQFYQADIESMEGAAFHYFAATCNLPFLQVRGISNWAGDRVHDNWKIEESLQAVHQSLHFILNHSNPFNL